MLANVIVRFRDRNTKTVYNIGTVFEGDEDRINELVELGFVEVIKKEVEENPEEQSDEQENHDVTSFLEGNVKSIKESLADQDVESLKILLETEKIGQNRKGVIEHIESLLEGE